MRMTMVAVGALMLFAPGGEVMGQAVAKPSGAFELGVGPAVGQGTGVGGHLTAGYVTAPTRFGLAIRLEGTLTTWRSLGDAGTWQGMRMSNAGVSLVQTLSRRALQPYLTAGGAAYTSQGAGVNFGLSGGAGLRFRVGAASLFTEARVHSVRYERDRYDDYARRLTTLTFGIRF